MQGRSERSIVAALIAGGCFAPTPPANVPCAANGTCPGGQTCDFTRPIPICGASELDASADTPSDPPTIPAGAALWLRMEDDPADGADDATGRHVSTCTACPSLVPGRVGNAFQFRLAGIDIAAAPDLEPNTGFTVAAWVRVKLAPAQFLGAVLRKGTSPSYGLLVLTDLSVVYYTGDLAMGSTPLTLDTWHHVAMTWDGARTIGYLDGVITLSAIGTATPMADPGPFSVGNLPLVPTEIAFDGAIDEVVFFNRVLGDTEIVQLASAIPFPN